MSALKALFIGGCERSGTTLLATLVGRHPQCCVTPESQFKIHAYRKFDWKSGTQNLARVASYLNGNFRYRLWGLNPEFLESKETEIAYSDLLRRIVVEYQQKSDSKSELLYWVDHTPDNIEYAATLLEMFPGIKFIHIVRDGRAVSASVMPLDWGPNTILACATWWSSKLSYGLALETFLRPDQILRIKYEDILCDTAGILARIYNFMGLKTDMELLPVERFTVPSYTSEQHNLVGKDVDAERMDAWKRRLTGRQVELFECRTRNLLAYLGYDSLYGIKASAPTPAEIVQSKCVEISYRRLVNPTKNLRRQLAARRNVVCA